MSKVEVNIPNRTPVNATITGVSVIESNDYNDLRNRPMINSVVLEGDLTAEDLGINNTVATIEETKQFLGIES